jgi:hypothetical protein
MIVHAKSIVLRAPDAMHRAPSMIFHARNTDDHAFYMIHRAQNTAHHALCMISGVLSAMFTVVYATNRSVPASALTGSGGIPAADY